MSREIDILRASACTFHWLCYLSKATDNDRLIAECAIKYPFVESLERHFVSNVALELKHPIYKDRRVDLYIGLHSDKNEFDKSEKEPVFVEFKFLKESPDPANVFIDLLRLRSIKKEHPESLCYLIVYGEKLVFNRLLTNNSRENDDKVELKTEITEKISKEGVLNKWLSEKGEVCTINMDMDYEKSILEKFCKEYQRRDGGGFKIDSFSTKLLRLFDKELGNDTLFSFGVWEVL
ncbi:MAG: hypothetical protein IJJ78_00980 [Paludibacteraceae bacterium]|nr:hypothetical protein [Paludibacteraceae bacterium]MBR0497641.1 hypothetical protein [Paludibacteraceae bacterium]